MCSPEFEMESSKNLIRVSFGQKVRKKVRKGHISKYGWPRFEKYPLTKWAISIGAASGI
jgi:hypothetical protein